MRVPSEAKGRQSPRGGELCWEKKLALRMNNRAQMFHHYNNLWKSSLGSSGKSYSGGQIVDFSIDTRVTCAVVNRPPIESSWQAFITTGISGSPESQFFLKLLECAVGGTILIHKFLYIPECPLPLWEGTCYPNFVLLSNHFLSRRTAGPSRACLAVPYKTAGRRRKATLAKRNWDAGKPCCVGCWKARRPPLLKLTSNEGQGLPKRGSISCRKRP